MTDRIAGHLLALVATCLLVIGTAAERTLAQDVAIELVSLGVGNVARPGDWVGIKLALTSNLTEAVTTEVSWEVPNADGDVCENTRTVTLAPGQKMERWVYGRLPPSSQALDLINQPYSVRVFETSNGRRLRELGATRISAATAATPSGAVDMDQDLILILGERRLGLEQYRDTVFTGYVAPPGVQCKTIIASGVNVAELPDRWEGIEPFSAIVWSEADRKPAQLKGEQAKALREWIWRGGTLVVSIAAAPDAWGIGRPGTHELEDLLPTATPTRSELLITDLLPILSKYDTVRDPSRMTAVWSWDAAKLDRGYRALVALPAPKVERSGFLATNRRPQDGAVVGIQRSYGFGSIVLLGIDVDEIYTRQVHATASVPQADIFWNRVLGRRGDTITPDEAARYQDTQPPVTTNVTTFSSLLGEGSLIAQQIGMTGQAAIGVLAAAGLFIGYWALSGPLGFFSLKQVRKDQHSWAMFVGFAFVFTAVAWAGGSLLRPMRADLKHVTVLDQLAFDPASPDTSTGIPEQRATSWLSVYLPGYGLTPLAVGAPHEANPNDLLASWSPPPSGTGDTFPNKDRYRVDADSQASYRVPARKTSADFVARWRGVVDPKWGSLVSVVQPIELRPDRTSDRKVLQLVGSIKHGLPGTLEQVRVLFVSPHRTPLAAMTRGAMPLPAPTTTGQLPLLGVMMSPPKGVWAPGTALNLSDLFGSAIDVTNPLRTGSIDKEFEDLYYEPIAQSTISQFGLGDSLTAERRRLYMEMLSFYWMLEPPHWYRTSSGEPKTLARAGRTIGRELDLSPWFTRPCIIVTGFLDGSASPVPVYVDGEQVNGSGVTMFRWIYPLDAPVEFTVPDAESTARAPAPPQPPSPPATPSPS
ncbi:MAG: hypothetical protein U0572_13745 [Phycisphaerales bacterium]